DRLGGTRYDHGLAHGLHERKHDRGALEMTGEGSMNRFIVLAVTIALAPAAWGQLYKYVDKDGKVVYTDQPPASADSKELKAPPPGPAPAAAPKAPVENVPPAKSRIEARQAPRAAKADGNLPPGKKEERCQRGRANCATFLDGGETTMRDTGTGKRSALDEKQLPAETAKAKAAMEAACKKD